MIVTMRGDKKDSKWMSKVDKSFELLKENMIEQLVLALLDFNKVFQVNLDAIGNTIRAVLSQESRPVAYFSENLNDARRRYFFYDQEFYAIIQALKKWRHFFFTKEFLLYVNHQALQYLNSQGKLKSKTHEVGRVHADLYLCFEAWEWKIQQIC
jgi:DhnA family fructose-bisphosphate aldolase class Ia